MIAMEKLIFCRGNGNPICGDGIMKLCDENIRNRFYGAADFTARKLRCGDFELHAYFIDGLVSGNAISEYVIKPLSVSSATGSVADLYRLVLEGMVYNAVAVPCTDVEQVCRMLVNGFCVILFPGVGAVAFEVKTGEKRSIAPPELENTAKGARDAFVETVRTNTSLIRRHLRSPDLRLYETQVGRRSLTNVSVVWLEGVTNPELVDRMVERLGQINIDGFLTTSAVEEYVGGSRLTAFPLLQYTQRADWFCQGILDGRIGLLVDGIPLGYLLPVDIGYLMNSPEDYGRDAITASAIRVLRYVALVLDLVLPALYIAMTVFHFHALPNAVAQVIMQGRETVPFSPVWEILTLLLAFELLQESGIHLPQNIGQSVSIIGGIVVGTVGVEAGLISAIALIAVSIAGVCGFVLPNRDLAGAIRLWRFLLSVLSAVLGLLGIVVGIGILIIRLAVIKSMGMRYLLPFESGLARKRLFQYKYRNPRLGTVNRRKQR